MRTTCGHLPWVWFNWFKVSSCFFFSFVASSCFTWKCWIFLINIRLYARFMTFPSPGLVIRLFLHTKPDFVLMNSYKVHFSVEDTFFPQEQDRLSYKNIFSLNHVSLLYLLCNPLSAGGAVCLSLALQRLAEETAAKHSRLAWSLLMKCLAFVLLRDNDKNTSYPIIAASFLICAPIKLTLTWKSSSHSHHYILVQERFAQTTESVNWTKCIELFLYVLNTVI